MRIAAFRHAFVDFIPDNLEAGVLYVSITYATAIHACACGCGKEIVTPITLTDWTMSFDGDSVSLDPSIGNWSLACRSHYWIRRGQVVWAPTWSDQEIQSARMTNRVRKELHFHDSPERPTSTSKQERQRPSFWTRLGKWLTRRPPGPQR